MENKDKAKVGDRVRVDTCEVNKPNIVHDDRAGVVDRLDMNDKPRVVFKDGDFCWPYKWHFIEPTPTTPSLNGCEQCANCPAGAKKGDKCPKNPEHWHIGGVPESDNFVATRCINFVQKSCSNCGNDGRARGGAVASCTVVHGGSCRSSPVGTHEVEYWIPRKAETPKAFLSEYGKPPVPLYDRKPGAAGNVAPVGADGRCPVSKECPEMKWLEGLKANATKRAEKAEKELTDAILHKCVGEDKCSTIIDLKAKMRQPSERYWRPYVINNEFYDDKSKFEELIFKCPVDEPKYISDTDWTRAMIHAARPSFRDVCFYREDVVQKKVAAAEQRAKEANMARQHAVDQLNDIRENLKNDYPPQPMPETHVPKWAKEYKGKCCSCKHFRRFLYLDMCSKKSCVSLGGMDDLYEPRYTRSQRRTMSMAGKLKDAQYLLKVSEADVNHQKQTIHNLEGNHTAALAKKDAQIAAVEQKGIEAVAKVAQTAEAKVNVMVERLNKERAEHEAYKKASVPLANIIEKTTKDQKIEVDKRLGTWLQTVVFEVAKPIDFTDVVLYKKAKEETKP